MNYEFVNPFSYGYPYHQIYYKSHLNLPKKIQRKGKWVSEEEVYAKMLIQAFNEGILNIPEGTTLRNFLSECLICDPMRITKKFSGSNSIGKQVYSKTFKYDPNSEEVKLKLKELIDLGEKFLSKIELQLQEEFNQLNFPFVPSQIPISVSPYAGYNPYLMQSNPYLRDSYYSFPINLIPLSSTSNSPYFVRSAINNQESQLTNALKSDFESGKSYPSQQNSEPSISLKRKQESTKDVVAELSEAVLKKKKVSSNDFSSIPELLNDLKNSRNFSSENLSNSKSSKEALANEPNPDEVLRQLFSK